MYLTRASTSIISLLLSTTMLFKVTLANPPFPTCTPTPGKHQLQYHSCRGGEDIIFDILDPNCQSIYQERFPHRGNGALTPDGRTMHVHGWDDPVTISFVKENWSYMRGAIVTWDHKDFTNPDKCGTDTQAEETVCLTTF